MTTFYKIISGILICFYVTHIIFVTIPIQDTAFSNSNKVYCLKPLKTESISVLQPKTHLKDFEDDFNNSEFGDFTEKEVELNETIQYPSFKALDTSGQIDLYVNSWDDDPSYEDWAKSGAPPYLDAQDEPTNIVFGEPNGLGSNNGDIIGNFSFEDTTQTGMIDSVKLRVYGQASPTASNQVYFSVYLWDGSSWSNIMSFKGYGLYDWNELDVSSYVNTWSKINDVKIYLETVDLTGKTDGGQACDAALLQINWTIDTTPPVINSFNVDDLGNGTGRFWADVSDLKSDVENVTLKVNGTEYNMNYSAPYWIYQMPVVYNGYYNYSISNASDTNGNFLTNPSDIQNHTFDYDIIAPKLIEAYYIYTNDTFKANVTDNWGEIDMIFVNVTHVGGDSLAENLTAIMRNATSGFYINDTIDITTLGLIFFVIFGNDTAGNKFVSNVISGYNGENLIPSVSDITFSPYPIHSNESLTLSYVFFDANDDSEGGTEIRWYKNEVLQGSHNDSKIITSSSLIKGDQWYVTIRPKDGHEFGTLVNSSEEFGLITVLNSAPKITSYTYTLGNPSIPGVLIEDEDIIINYIFEDVDSVDNDTSRIMWYIDDEYYIQYDGLKIISANKTKNNETWRVEIHPYDGYNYGKTVNMSIFIESRPVIIDYGFEYLEDKEGHLLFWINATNSLNPLSEVLYSLFLNGSDLPQKRFANLEEGSADLWKLNYELSDYSYLNLILVVEVTVTTEVFYLQTYGISSKFSFNFTIEDHAPPRVTEVNLERNDERNPTNLTFVVTIEEFGSGIEEVILYYYFTPSNDTTEQGGIGTDEPQWLETSMTLLSATSSSSFWSVTVDFPSFNYDVDIIYRIYTRDNDENENPVAFDVRDYPQLIRDQRFIYHSPGFPAELVLLMGFLIIVSFIGSIVYIKFIRKPEVIGFDKELVLSKIKDINENDVITSLELHTLGVVLSFFDQLHGPVPIIIEPELLKDNYSKLVDLSDRAFSGTGFTDDFSSEILSYYDFVLASGIKINVMTFGFSLENPESRGGKENLTLNILVNRNIFPLVKHFEEDIQEKVHESHVLMQKDPSERKKIHDSVVEVRKYISNIVLAYKNIYGTTELVTEDE